MSSLEDIVAFVDKKCPFVDFCCRTSPRPLSLQQNKYENKQFQRYENEKIIWNDNS